MILMALKNSLALHDVEDSWLSQTFILTTMLLLSNMFPNSSHFAYRATITRYKFFCISIIVLLNTLMICVNAECVE